jgi:hypothetical protein
MAFAAKYIEIKKSTADIYCHRKSTLQFLSIVEML